MNTKKATLILTVGCPAGISPEITVRTLMRLEQEKPAWLAHTQFVYAGAPEWLQLGYQHSQCNLPTSTKQNKDGSIWSVGSLAVFCLHSSTKHHSIPGIVTPSVLEVQQQSLLDAIHYAKQHTHSALVTPPIRKAALHMHGMQFPGQTELLHHHLGTDERGPLMIFTGGPFALALATIHLPLREVPHALTATLFENKLSQLIETMFRFHNRPVRIGVLGLNPHAGEDGLLGQEEKNIYFPVIEALRIRYQSSLSFLSSPLPADGFFADIGRRIRQQQAMEYDGVLAMTHDQGLGPYKLLAHGAGVNMTMGLSHLRTSPDHGTGDAIAGKGVADAAAMYTAMTTAALWLHSH